MPKDSDNDKEPNITESARYWRLNTIDGLRMTKRGECEAKDPEHLETIKANNAELARLEAKEAAVKTRHAAIIEQRRKNTQNNDKSR